MMRSNTRLGSAGMFMHWLQRRITVTSSLALAVLAAWAGSASAAITISPSPSTTGNYTVSFPYVGCQPNYSYYPYFMAYDCYLLEESTNGGSPVGITTTSSTSWSATGKAVGAYAYDIYYTNTFTGGHTVYSGPVTVVVGTPPPRDPLPTQLTYQFQTRQGDLAPADGKTDIFVKRVSGGAAGNGVLDSVILKQNSSGGAFSMVVPTPAQAAAAASWPVSSVTTVITDFNVDGYVDVEVKGVAAATGGSSDQIIFSPGAPLVTQPLALRAVDDSLKKFVGNMLDYAVNPGYFPSHATLKPYNAMYSWLSCNIGSNSYSGVILDGTYSLYPIPVCVINYILITGYQPDYTAFSQPALEVWTNEQAAQAGTTSKATTTESAQEAAEGVLGAQIGGWPMEEVLGPSGDYTDPDIRRGLETFWSILGIGKANAAEVHTDQAPSQYARTFGAVYITAHHVLGLGPLHTALEYASTSVPTTTLSAGPENGPAYYLNSAVNRPTDAPWLNMTLGTVSNPQTDGAGYWTQLLLANAHYPNNVFPYTLFPSASNAHNSNSYTAGIVIATGGVTAVPLSTFVGGQFPIPANSFQ